MNQRPYDRQFQVPSGAVLESGGSLNLVKGQIGLFAPDETDANGLVAYFDLKGASKEKRFEIRSGRGRKDTSRSQSEKDFSTPQFMLKEVVGLRVSVPERDEPSVDDVILGWNGINDDTAIDLKKGDRIPVFLLLKGKAIELMGYPKGEVLIEDYIGVEECEYINPMMSPCAECNNCDGVDCSQYIKEFIDRVRSKPLRNLKTVGDYIDILPSISCGTEPTPKNDYVFWTTTLCDTGDDFALALVKAQYPEYEVVRKSYEGSISTYEMLVPVAVATITDVKQTFEAMIKGCADCPTGYDKLTGGFIYSVSLVDESVDQSSTIEGLPNAIAGSAKYHGSNEETGFYTVVLSKKLTKDEITTFATANPTFQIRAYGSVVDFCKDTTENTAPWVKGDTCYTTTEEYQITLADGECGESRLVELQNKYSELVIEEVADSAKGCQRIYKTTVETNMVCDECDPIFRDYFTSKAPSPYGRVKWVLQSEENASIDCKCGVRFRGRVFQIDPGECLLDQMDFVEDSVRIEISAGLAETTNLNQRDYNKEVAVTRLSDWAPRTHLGGNLRRWENQMQVYGTGEARHYGNLFARDMFGEFTALEGGKQYADYVLTIRPHKYSGGWSDITQDTIDFHFIVEMGRTDRVEALLNNIAAAAEIPTVAAYGA